MSGIYDNYYNVDMKFCDKFIIFSNLIFSYNIHKFTIESL